MSLFDRVRERGKEALAKLGKKPEQPVQENAQFDTPIEVPEEEKQVEKRAEKEAEREKAEEKVDIQRRIDLNQRNAKKIIQQLEELRFRLGGNERAELTAAMVVGMDKMITVVQNKLDSAVDVTRKVAELDQSAAQLIVVIKDYIENSGVEQLVNAFNVLCDCLSEARYSNDDRKIKYGDLRLQQARIELQKAATQRHHEQMKLRRKAISKAMNEAEEQNKDTTQLNAAYTDYLGLIKVAAAEIDEYDGLLQRLIVLMSRLETLPNDISLDELVGKIMDIEEAMRQDMQAHTEQVKAYHEKNVRSMEESKLNLQKIMDMLPGRSLESREETQRILSELRLEEEKVEKRVKTEEARVQVDIDVDEQPMTMTN